MIGGNIKNRLTVPCKLSLPTVVSGAGVKARFPGARLTTDLRFALPAGTWPSRCTARPSRRRRAPGPPPRR